MSTTFVVLNGRSPSNRYATINNFHNQPAAQNSKPSPQPDSQFPEIDDEVNGRSPPESTPRENSKKGNGRFPSKPFATLQNLAKLAPREPTTIWEKDYGQKPAKMTGQRPVLTPCSVALARLTNAFAIHQSASHPRHRASVGCMAC